MDRTPRSVTFIGAEQTVLCATNLLTATTTATTPRLTPTGKISHAKTRVYTQRYRKEWELMQDFAGWLTSVPSQPTRAYCNYCQKNLHAHRLSLLKHTCTMKHQRAALTHQLKEKKKLKLDPNAVGSEVGLIEEVETMDDHQMEIGDENEEEIEYVVERLETDEEDCIESQVVKEESGEIDCDEEEEKEMNESLCAQLQSDDDNSKPTIKKIKLISEQKRDTLAQAMAHVHSEYLEEDEIIDQENVQMEMVVESANPDMSILPDSLDNTKTSTESPESQRTDMKPDKKLIAKILQEENKTDVVVTSSLPTLNTSYQTITTSSSNTLNFMPIAPDLKTPKTITLLCGTKTFELTGGMFQPGTQYVLTKLPGKPATLIMADQKKTAVVNEQDKMKTAESSVSNTNQPSMAVPSTSQQSAAVINEQSIVSAKLPLSKKVFLGKQQSIKFASKKLRISTYVTDITKGIPIGGLQVSLYKLMDGKWTFLNESNTNSEGHCNDLVEKMNCTAGRYKIHFDVDKYFTLRRIETIFPFVEIVFDVKSANGHYHMPLLLGPFGYTVYRGT